MRLVVATALRYTGWTLLVVVPWFLLLFSEGPVKGRPPVGDTLFSYFLAFVLVVGVLLSLILRHLIQRSRRELNPAKIHAFMEEMLRKEPTPERFHEAGVFCCEAGEWERAIAYLGRVPSTSEDLYRSARYHLLIAYLESFQTEDAARLQAEMPQHELTSDERYNLALAYKKQNFLGRAKEQFLNLFLTDIGFRDVGKQLEEIDDLERMRRALAPEHRFLVGAVSERYSQLRVSDDQEGHVECVAHDRDVGRLVVLRVLKPDRASEAGIEGFLREARALAAFDHPHILKVYDIRKERLPYFSLEPFEGQPSSELPRMSLATRLQAMKQMAELAEYLGGFDPEDLLVGNRGEVRLAAIGPAPRTVPAAFFLQVLRDVGEPGAMIEHSVQEVRSLLDSSASMPEVLRALEAAEAALRLDAEQRQSEEMILALKWLEWIHRQWIHGLKSKFAIIRRFPDDWDRARTLFGREENLEEVSRMLGGLAEELEHRADAVLVARPELTSTMRTLEALNTAVIIGRIEGFRDLSTDEAGELLTELSERFVTLSRGIARLLETFEIELGQLVGSIVRGSVYAGSIRFDLQEETGWSIRLARPREFRSDLRTILDGLLHNAFEADGTIVSVELTRDQERRYITVTVKDDGRGLPPELLERLARERYSSKSTGSGTGIRTAHRLAERHGGNLQIGNRTGRSGAEAILMLPTRVSDGEE